MSKKSRTNWVAWMAWSMAALTWLPWTTAQERTKEEKSGGEKASEQMVSGTTTNPSDASPATRKSSPTSSKRAPTNAPEKSNVEDSPKSSRASKSSSTSKAESKPAKSTGNTLRLPRYFAGLVDQRQREAIYARQLEFRSRIAELEEELARVRQDELMALEELLTDSQRKLLSQKRAEATATTKANLSESGSTDSDQNQ